METSARCLYPRISEVRDLGHFYILNPSFGFRTTVLICSIFKDCFFLNHSQDMLQMPEKFNLKDKNFKKKKKKDICSSFSRLRIFAFNLGHWIHFLKSETPAVMSFWGALGMDGKHSFFIITVTHLSVWNY